MRNMLALFAVLLLTFLGVGWWRTWYNVDGEPSTAGRVAFRVEIDVQKVGGDIADGWRYVTGSGTKESEEKAEAAK